MKAVVGENLKRLIAAHDRGIEAACVRLDMSNQPETPAHTACVERMYGMVRDNQEAARRQGAANAAAAGAAILLAPPIQPTQTTCRWFAGNYICQ